MTIVEFLTARLDDTEENAHFLAAMVAPDWVLADVAAKRLVVDIHEGLHSCGFSDYDDEDPCDTLKALASVYAEHPEYDPGWKP